MKTALLSAMLAGAVAVCAQAPDATNPQSGAVEAKYRANSGTVLRAELIRGLDARKSKPGDAVIARCRQDLKINGEVRIPKNTKLIGHVVEVQRKGQGKTESTLGILFDRAIMRDGSEVPLIASIQALAPPAFMTAEVGDTDFHIRNTPAATPQPSGLLPGAVKAVSHQPPAIDLPPLSATSTGVIGVNGLRLESGASALGGVSVIRSNSQNVRLESGTRLILRVSLP
jgi:hypothetical protein